MNYKAILLTLGLSVAGASAANAQIFVPSAVANGTVLGGIAGALIGGHNHNNWAAGAVIGAATGAVVGAAVDDSQRQVAYAQPAVYTYDQAPAATYVADAPTAPAAPVAPAAPQYAAAAPQYGTAVATPSTPAPQVVYVTQAPAATYYYDSYPAYYPYGYYGYGYGYPVGVSVGLGWGWGGRYYGRGGYYGGHYAGGGWGGHGRR